MGDTVGYKVSDKVGDTMVDKGGKWETSGR